MTEVIIETRDGPKVYRMAVAQVNTKHGDGEPSNVTILHPDEPHDTADGDELVTLFYCRGAPK